MADRLDRAAQQAAEGARQGWTGSALPMDTVVSMLQDHALALVAAVRATAPGPTVTARVETRPAAEPGPLPTVPAPAPAEARVPGVPVLTPPAGPPTEAAKRWVPAKPLRMPRKRAMEVLDTAALVKADDWAESSRWVLRSGDTVIGTLAPDYRGVKRSGWRGTVHQTTLLTESGTTREQASVHLAGAWLRQVTAKPKRT